MHLPRDPYHLEIYSEAKQSRVLVGKLTSNQEAQTYTFEYDRKYLLSKAAIPLGPDLSLKKRVHHSKKGELFPSLQDRIPSQGNPAYEEYCRSQGIDSKETNPIILLATIGKRGPSTFVFESLYVEQELRVAILKFRQQLGLSVREISMAFDLNYPTLSRIETGKSSDKNTMRLLEIYFSFPEVSLWAIKRNERKLHQAVSHRLISFFTEKLKANRRQASFVF